MQAPPVPPKVYSSFSPRRFESTPSAYEYEDSKENMPPTGVGKVQRKPVPLPTVQHGEGNLLHAPSSPVKVEAPAPYPQHEPSSAQIEEYSGSSLPNSRSASGNLSYHNMTPPPTQPRLSPSPQGLPAWLAPRDGEHGDLNALHYRSSSGNSHEITEGPGRQFTPSSSRGHHSQNSLDAIQQDLESYQPLQYHHQAFESAPQSREHSRGRYMEQRKSAGSQDELGNRRHHERVTSSAMAERRASLRPDSALSSGSPGRSPVHTPDSYARARSRARSVHSLSGSPGQSYVDLLNVPYPQAPAVSVEHLDNPLLRNAIGNNASLLTIRQTIEMYRANIKKTTDPAIQYEFAVFMITCAQEANLEDDQNNPEKSYGSSRSELLKEARQLLQKLSDRSYPFAQYYLADGYASGLFNKGKEDHDRAFPLFVSAAKHGHAEAGYRAALCYEFGWGTKMDAHKAVPYYRQSASKNHPGAMLRLGRACLMGDMGLRKTYKEGVKWLKRAAESADFQYNSAPYELGVLHETGFGDDIFRDESYSAQLFTKSADLGHAGANYRLGDAYEHGKLNCPRDPALSVHFYTGAAQLGHPVAMMALCAWYLLGAEPILEKDENEAYEWAKKAAQAGMSTEWKSYSLFMSNVSSGFPKAEYAVGYFTETGIGCRRDPLEANVWYVRAADHGDDRAKHRLAAIKAASTGADPETAASGKMSKGAGAGNNSLFIRETYANV